MGEIEDGVAAVEVYQQLALLVLACGRPEDSEFVLAVPQVRCHRVQSQRAH